MVLVLEAIEKTQGLGTVLTLRQWQVRIESLLLLHRVISACCCYGIESFLHIYTNHMDPSPSEIDPVASFVELPSSFVSAL